LIENKDNIFKDHPELDKLFNQLVNNKNIQTHHILVLILRLRQLCCHPCLLKNVWVFLLLLLIDNLLMKENILILLL